MKLVLIMVAVLVGIWLFRSNRKTPAKPAQTPSQPTSAQLEMVRCRHCDMHFPKSDSIAGRQGAYCSLEHRQLAEH